MRKNNLDLGVLASVVERGQSDPGVFKMHKRVEGSWNFAEGTPAYTASMVHGERTTSLTVDVAPGFGGGGLAPDPLQYMLTGLGACYAATVVTVAAMEGVDLTALSVVAEQDVDVARVYDMGDGPLMEQISVTVTVATDVSDDTLARWQQAAREKCPFAFTVINAIPLHTVVRRA
ncbi:MAG: OsmC family protein [Cellulomonas sp.]|uniref:OsmC family protein n=1 Tax=Cellulomonas sp. TaxID=40001 RepID=UPI0017AB8034|nr:OsmC family protein [Cellulomonas sp.]NMM30063.1 OsmC family protein [Cellulomonas sp.]